MFDEEYGYAMQGNRASSCDQGELSWFFLSCSGNLGDILKLQRGWTLKTHLCSATSGLQSSHEGHFRKLLEACQGNTDASQGEAGDPGSLSSCHSDIGIPISFQQESGIVTSWSTERLLPL